MGLLTESEQQDMALAHGYIFSAVCDDCERGIKAGTMFVVLKYHKQNWEGPGQKPFTWNRRIPKKIRCMDCQQERTGHIKPEKKRMKLGKGRKKLTPEELEQISPLVVKLAIRMLKKSPEPLQTNLFKTKLWNKCKRYEPKIKKGMVNLSIRLMKKSKTIVCKKRLWQMPKVKKS